MKTITALTFLAFTFCTAFLDTVGAQPLTITTIAGQYGNGNFKNGIGTNATFSQVGPMAADPAGNLYLIDGTSIQKISPDLTVTTFAGSPQQSGYLDATGINARFSAIQDIAVDKNGYIYVADYAYVNGNYSGFIRKISPSAVVTTLTVNVNLTEVIDIAVDSSGNIYVVCVTSVLNIGKITPDGVFSILTTNAPPLSGGDHYNGLAVDGAGIVYVTFGSGIQKVSPGTVSTWVGSRIDSGTELDGPGTSAAFWGANKIALDRSGGAYVTDLQGQTIRYVSAAGVVSTVAGLAYTSPTINNDGVGSNARFLGPNGITVDTAGNVYITDGGGTVLKGVPPSLPPIGLFTESPGGTPVRSNNPWQFTASFTALVSDLRLSVQSTTTPTDKTSWTALPGFSDNSDMTEGVAGNWTLNRTDVPTGTQYFRVVASAPGYFDSSLLAVGSETVLDGIAPLGDLNWETTGPDRTGALWTFTITEPSLIPNLRLQVQSSSDNLTRWGDLPDGGWMINQDGTWTLDTTNLPVGQQWFRVVASAPTYVDRISPSWGAFNIEAALTPVTITTSGAGNYTIPLDAQELLDSAHMVFLTARANAKVQFLLTGNFQQLMAAATLAADQYSSVRLTVDADQTLTDPAINVGPDALLENKGKIIGNVALNGGSTAAALIGQDGGALIGPGGGAITGNAISAAIIVAPIVAQGAGNIVAQGAGNLISKDGSHLISQDGGGIVASGAGNIVASGAGKIASTGGSNVVGVNGPAVINRNVNGFTPEGSPFQPKPNLPLPTQPTFTGLMTINGNYSQFPGTALIIGIAGTNTLAEGAQQFDQLVVSGTAYLAGGTIAFGLFDPDDQTNLANVFQPPDGATFDVVVASNIVVNALHLFGPVWGDGLFFKGGVVTLTNGLQAVRLMATHIPPHIFLQNAGPKFHLVYGTNYTGYTVESSTNLSDWSAFSTGTNVVVLSPTNASRFFRLSKP
jgi:hypothetical protein